ncbi:MAG: glycosyl transferase [Alphaproteobacteria bacterium]|nr:glycosyl transferase [Alphaproteobacteria bacterium]
MAWTLLFVAAVASYGATRVALHYLIEVLRRRAILDRPNERSSHRVATPRGGGIAVIGVTAIVWLAAGTSAGAPWTVLAVVGPALALACLSWFDDRRGLPIWLRLAAQFVAVGGGLLLLAGEGSFMGGWLPPMVEIVAAGLLWVWFINLFNFMDGIDGIAGVESVVLGGGILVVVLVAGADPRLGLVAAIPAAAALAFLARNWPPAQIFLGDVGSVPLGYLFGFLLLWLAREGHAAAALLLPLYYLVDATVTLLARLGRGERVWQAHRQHFYQQAARRFASHARPVVWIAALNAVLILLAVASALHPVALWPCVALGAGLVGALLWYFAEMPQPTRKTPVNGD